METSRDDFVIAIRSAFLKKETQQRFSLLGLIFFSLIILTLGSLNFKAVNYIKIIIKEVVYRSSFIVSGPEKFIKRNYLVDQNHLKLYEESENSKLQWEVLKSKNLLNKFIILENKRLKSIIGNYSVDSNEIIAKVLIDKQSPFLRSIVINKGSKHSIKLGMVALDREYLVGKVVEVNYGSSRILLLSDLNSKIPVIMEPKGILSILSGTGKDNGIIQYYKNEDIDQDISIIYTSGSSGLFKAGIPVGKIKNYDFDKKNLVTFFSDFSQLNFVKIIAFKNFEEK